MIDSVTTSFVETYKNMKPVKKIRVSHKDLETMQITKHKLEYWAAEQTIKK